MSSNAKNPLVLPPVSVPHFENHWCRPTHSCVDYSKMKQLSAKNRLVPSRFETVTNVPGIFLTGRGLTPRGGVILLWPQCHFEGDKVLLCCGCKLPLLCVQGQLEEKGMSPEGCSGGTEHVKEHVSTNT